MMKPPDTGIAGTDVLETVTSCVALVVPTRVVGKVRLGPTVTWTATPLPASATGDPTTGPPAAALMVTLPVAAPGVVPGMKTTLIVQVLGTVSVEAARLKVTVVGHVPGLEVDRENGAVICTVMPVMAAVLDVKVNVCAALVMLKVTSPKLSTDGRTEAEPTCCNSTAPMSTPVAGRDVPK